MDLDAAPETTLRYLDRNQAKIGGKCCDDITVRAATGHPLGRLEGFIIDPTQRQLRYFVIRTTWLPGGSRLIPLTAARLNVEDHAIELLSDDHELTPAANFPSFPQFSDEDFLNAIFARRNWATKATKF
jgi:hypothetical protein